MLAAHGSIEMKTHELKPARKARVLIAVEHPGYRAELAQIINREKDLCCCGEAGDDADWERVVGKLEPELLVLELPLRGGEGMQKIKELKARFPALPLLVVTQDDETFYAEHALRSGARGYVMKAQSRTELLRAMRTVLRGGLYVSRNISSLALHRLLALPSRAHGDPVDRLSTRELQVFQMLGRGRRTREIAAELQLSRKTVATHRENIKRKLGLPNAVALVAHAVRWMHDHSPTDSSAPRSRPDL